MLGIDSIAPFPDTVIPAALFAIRNASSGFLPCDIEARKKPVNVSPAPVVSTAGTFSASVYKSKYLDLQTDIIQRPSDEWLKPPVLNDS